MRRVVLLGGVIALAAACAGGIRPAYEPFPQALADTVTAAPAAAVETIVSQLVTEGLRIQWQSAAEGYIETQWYDVIARQSGSFDRAQLERYVRLRFFVNPVGTDRAEIIAEAVSLGRVDPSRPERENEIPAASGTAGHTIVTRVLRQVVSTLGG